MKSAASEVISGMILTVIYHVHCSKIHNITNQLKHTPVYTCYTCIIDDQRMCNKIHMHSVYHF